MKINHLFLFILLTGCAASFSKQQYRSINGEQLTLKKKNVFEFKDVVPYGHHDLYVVSKGTYRIQKDTTWLTHLETNADSLYANGKKVSYDLPAFVTKNQQGDVFLLKNGSKKILQRITGF